MRHMSERHVEFNYSCIVIAPLPVCDVSLALSCAGAKTQFISPPAMRIGAFVLGGFSKDWGRSW